MDLTNMDVSSSSTSDEPETAGRDTASDDGETSPTRTGPPSETSSQEWDRLTDPGSQSAAP